MFIRRHHLLRLNVLKPTSLCHSNNLVGLATRFPAHTSAHVRCTPDSPLPRAVRNKAGPVNTRQLHTGLRNYTPKTHVVPPHTPYTSARATATSSEAATGSYFRSDNPDATSLIHMPVQDVKDELTLLANHQDTERLRTAANDIIRFYHGSYAFDHDAVVHHMFGLAKTHNVFDLTTLHDLLLDLQNRGSLPKTPLFILATVAHATIAQATASPDPTHEIPIYAMLYPLLIQSLSARPPTSRNQDVRFSPMQVQWVLFKIITRLAQEEQFEAIMPMIDALVHSGTIPESTMQDLPTTGFAQIVFTILLRCCLDWGWRSRAAYLLLRTPEWNKVQSPAFNEIVREVVQFVLEAEEEPSNPQVAAALMVRIVNNTDVLTLSDASVRRFYDLMMKYDLAHHARAVFELTRSRRVREAHVYPPPQGRAFTWLLGIAAKEKFVHTTRALVREVVEEQVEVPPLARPYVITEAAVHGFMSHARMLWTRWKEDVRVAGDPGANLRLVSLVVNRVAAVAYKADRMAREEAERAKEAGAELPEDFTVNPSGWRREWYSGDAAARPSFEEQVADYRAFADHVVATFRACHEPLENAHHRILNALARLYIMTGNVTEGFAVLQVIRDRHQPPDIRDVNVALTALTNHNPHAAARILLQMIDAGLQPDAVSFGTVIHQAALHGDVPLVTSLVARAREIGIAQLDYKTIGSLIRAAVSTPYDGADTDAHGAQLADVEALVDSLLQAQYTPSPQMGVDCVHAALRADDPRAAHRFWTLLVRDHIEYGDFKQRAMRRRVARLVGRHLSAGTLAPDEAHRMLRELGFGAERVVDAQEEAQDTDAAGEAQDTEEAGEREAKDEQP